MEMDEKMDLFLDKEIWEQAISHGVCKRLDKSLLNTACSPYGRLAIAEAIEQGRYKIQPPTVSEIPKPNGKIREVYANIPRIYLKNWICKTITSFGEANKVN